MATRTRSSRCWLVSSHPLHERALGLFRRVADGDARRSWLRRWSWPSSSTSRRPRWVGRARWSASGSPPCSRQMASILPERPTILRALSLYAAGTRLDFADAYLAAAALEVGPGVVASFDVRLRCHRRHPPHPRLTTRPSAAVERDGVKARAHDRLHAHEDTHASDTRRAGLDPGRRVRHRWGTSTVTLDDQGDRIVIEPAPDDPIAAAEGRPGQRVRQGRRREASRAGARTSRRPKHVADSMTLLDAYALVAFLVAGPAAAEVRAILREGHAVVATANLAEALDVSQRLYGLPIARAMDVLEPVFDGHLAVRPLDVPLARRAAEIRAQSTTTDRSARSRSPSRHPRRLGRARTTRIATADRRTCWRSPRPKVSRSCDCPDRRSEPRPRATSACRAATPTTARRAVRPAPVAR